MTDRQKLIELTLVTGISGFCFPQLKVLDDEELLAFLWLLEKCRYLSPRSHNVPKSNHWLHHVLSNSNFDEKRFRAQLRMDKGAFSFVVDLLKDTEAFQSTGEIIPLQIAVGFYKLGTYGNGSSVRNVATKFGISEGSVENFTGRTVEALVNISSQWIRWPNKHERRQLGSRMATKLLPKCIGFIDGTEVTLFNAPLEDKETYWSRKKKYCFQFQIVCDDSRMVRHFFIGYPGSVHDAKVFSNSEICRHPENFFSMGEFLIGDSAYPKSETQVVPYKRFVPLSQKQRTFNRHVSKNRVVVEHTIGILKRRFPSLLGLRLRVDKTKGHEKVCKWTGACVVLHNILMTIDPWNQIDDYRYEEDDGHEEPFNFENFNPSNTENAAEMKRLVLTEIISAMC